MNQTEVNTFTVTFSKNPKYKQYQKNFSRNTSLGANFAETFNRTIRDLLNKPVFEKGDVNWNDSIPSITKHYSRRILSSTKSTTLQASLKKNEGYVYRNLLDKRKK